MTTEPKHDVLMLALRPYLNAWGWDHPDRVLAVLDDHSRDLASRLEASQALAGELAEALEGLRVSFLSRLGDRENEEWDTNYCKAMAALAKFRAAQSNNPKPER